MIRIWLWANTHYSRYQRRRQNLSQQHALEIIPSDEAPSEIMQAFKTEWRRRYGNRRNLEAAASPIIRNFPFWALCHNLSKSSTRRFYPLFTQIKILLRSLWRG